jgi:hypothetical protein
MKVKDFKGFMNSKSLNEQDAYDGTHAGANNFGANPEEEMPEEEEMPADEFAEDEEGMEEEEVTLEDLKAIVDDLTERLEALEGPGEEDEEMDEEGEDEEMDEEGEEEEAPEEEEV